MELRGLTGSDMDQALMAHGELAAEQFDFLFSYDDGLDWAEYLEKVEETRRGENLPEEHVPATFLIVEVDGDLVGRVSIRHRLNPMLRTVGGHIGYAVRPQFRRRGHAQQMLKHALVEARHLGIDHVLVTCDADDPGSRITIERCGGVLEAPLAVDTDTTVKLRYWIDTWTMDPVQTSVRPAVDHDAARLAEIHIAAWQATYRGIMTDERLDGMSAERAASNWQRNIADPAEGTEHLVIVHDDLPVGFAIFGPAPDDCAVDTGQLYALNLHPDWWAQGLGSTLFSAAEHRLAALGYARAFLWVAKGNQRAISFYTKHGWFDDGGTLEDAHFDPPITELRHSRVLDHL